MTVFNVTRPRENSNFTEHAQKPVCVSVLVLARRGSAAGETVKSVRTHAFPTSARTHAGQVTHTREAGMGCGSRPQLGLVSRSRRLPRRAREALWFLSVFSCLLWGLFLLVGFVFVPPPGPRAPTTAVLAVPLPRRSAVRAPPTAAPVVEVWPSAHETCGFWGLETHVHCVPPGETPKQTALAVLHLAGNRSTPACRGAVQARFGAQAPARLPFTGPAIGRTPMNPWHPEHPT